MSKTADPQLDDLEAVRKMVSALEKFPRDDQHRILRWAQEKLGIDPHVPAAPANPPPFISPPPGTPPTTPPSGGATDIRTFMTRKKPASDNQLAAAIAYYYQFEAPPGSRKNGIKSEDLKEAARAMGQGGRFNKPAQTLVSAHQQGLLDRLSEGGYTVSNVGENLVAVTLGAEVSGAAAFAPRKKSKARRGTAKKSAKTPGASQWRRLVIWQRLRSTTLTGCAMR